MVRFGTAGVGDSFAEQGYKKTAEVGEYLTGFGLSHFEYQCGQGVRLSEASGKAIGAELAARGITVSLHAPYFISLSSVEEAKRTGSVRYILESARAVKALGGTRIVIHSGSCAKMSREAALALALDTMKLAKAALDENGFSDVICCPETMGKFNQLGTLEEVLTICELDESFIPCIDFGHLNARTVGGIKTKSDFAKILDSIKNRLGEYRYKHFHSHFSKIMYTEKGGEKKHLTFADFEYGPAFEPLIELIAERDLSPYIVCESDGTQAEDAATMKNYLEKIT
ncbi:MAG: TIM barrel protein [Ruminococcus sp.]|jgi:deoxyribonuclease-4|nr:TIM barrel protein [Ruminococcus sp.]